MANIFIALYNGVNADDPSVLPCFYESFVKGLSDAGNAVMIETTNMWKFPTEKCPQHLAEKIRSFNPDICFLFNNYFYDISNIVNCPVVVYEADSFLYYQNKTVLYEKPNNFYYFVFQTHSIDVLRQELHVDKNRICHVPFFTEVRANKESVINNICFCGSKFTNGDKESIVHKLMCLNPTNKEKQQFRQCLNLIVQNPYITVKEIEKEIGVLSDKIISIVESPYIIPWLSDFRRINTLSSVESLGLDLYGTHNWINCLSYSSLPVCYNSQKIVSLQDTEKLYNSHKIGININHIQATSGFGWRVADIMASNACLVSEFKPDFKLLFPNIKIPLFSSINDAYDICKKLLENESMRTDIVMQCQEVIDKKFRVKNALQTIEQFLGIPLIQSNKHKMVGQITFLPPITHKHKTFGTKIKNFITSSGIFFSSFCSMGQKTNKNSN